MIGLLVGFSPGTSSNACETNKKPLLIRKKEKFREKDP